MPQNDMLTPDEIKELLLNGDLDIMDLSKLYPPEQELAKKLYVQNVDQIQQSKGDETLGASPFLPDIAVSGLGKLFGGGGGAMASMAKAGKAPGPSIAKRMASAGAGALPAVGAVAGGMKGHPWFGWKLGGQARDLVRGGLKTEETAAVKADSVAAKMSQGSKYTPPDSLAAGMSSKPTLREPMPKNIERVDPRVGKTEGHLEEPHNITRETSATKSEPVSNTPVKQQTSKLRNVRLGKTKDIPAENEAEKRRIMFGGVNGNITKSPNGRGPLSAEELQALIRQLNGGR